MSFGKIKWIRYALWLDFDLDGVIIYPVDEPFVRCNRLAEVWHCRRNVGNEQRDKYCRSLWCRFRPVANHANQCCTP